MTKRTTTPTEPSPVAGLTPEQIGSALLAVLNPPPAPEPPATGRNAEPKDEPASYDVRAFCAAHSISRRMFTKLRAADAARERELGRPLLPSERKAPRCKAIGHKLIISREAAREWRNEE